MAHVTSQLDSSADVVSVLSTGTDQYQLCDGGEWGGKGGEGGGEGGGGEGGGEGGGGTGAMPGG